MSEITLPITFLLTAALAVLLVILSFSVTIKRGTLGVKSGDMGGFLFGDGGDEDLRHRIRAHGNFIEIAPMVIITIGLMEAAGASRTLLLIFAITFFVGRVLHALRFYLRMQPLGVLPILSQHLVCLGAAAWLFNHYLSI